MEMVSVSPGGRPSSPALVPEPNHSDIGPHLAYAIQWWLFSAMVPVGWVVLLRRERAEILAARAAKAEAAAAGPGGDDEEPAGDGSGATRGDAAADSATVSV
jgi:hypothetical protein